MALETIGNFLDREVRVIELGPDLLLREKFQLSDSVAMLCIDVPGINVQMLNSFLKDLVLASPLAILVSGQHARVIFDVLLELLANPERRSHIMTKLCDALDVSECVQEFFWATWPAEERFDNWKAYTTVIVGKPPFSASIMAQLQLMSRKGS